MKKILMLLAVLGVMAVFAAEGEKVWKFPGWRVSDVAVWQEAVDTAERADHLQKSTYMLAIAQNPPASFEEAKAAITAALQALDCDEAKILEKIKQYGCCTRNFLKETIAFAKANPCSYDFYLALLDDTDWGFDYMSEAFLKNKYSVADAKRGVDYLVRQAIQLDKDDAEMLALLRKLNRVFTALVAEDKEWENVVALVRSQILTY